MSKIREAYLQRCEIGLLARERNEGRRLCRENDIVCYCIVKRRDSAEVAEVAEAAETAATEAAVVFPLLEFTVCKTRLPLGIYCLQVAYRPTRA